MKNLEVERESTSAENFPHATNVTGASRIVKKILWVFFPGSLAKTPPLAFRPATPYNKKEVQKIEENHATLWRSYSPDELH
jgi:hypothetical protein